MYEILMIGSQRISITCWSLDNSWSFALYIVIGTEINYNIQIYLNITTFRPCTHITKHR